MQLKDRTAIVTGGGGAIGQAICQGLAREGARVAACDLNLEAAQRTASLLGPTGLSIQADVSKQEDVSRMVDEAVRHFGRLDIMVNGAGMLRRTPTLEMSVEEWDQVMAVNLRSMFLCCKAAALVMKEQGGGKIVNVTSGRGVTGMNGSVHYSASKGGVNGLTRSLGMEWAPLNINVNAVGPGITDTPLMRNVHTEEQMKARAAAQPNGRISKPEDVVGAVIYLCSDVSSTMYGQIIYMRTP